MQVRWGGGGIPGPRLGERWGEWGAGRRLRGVDGPTCDVMGDRVAVSLQAGTSVGAINLAGRIYESRGCFGGRGYDRGGGVGRCAGGGGVGDKDINSAPRSGGGTVHACYGKGREEDFGRGNRGFEGRKEWRTG